MSTVTHPCVTVDIMSNSKRYETNADRQKAYRARKGDASHKGTRESARALNFLALYIRAAAGRGDALAVAVSSDSDKRLIENLIEHFREEAREKSQCELDLKAGKMPHL